MEDSAGTILVWNDETSVHSCTAVYGMVGQGRARSRDDQKRHTLPLSLPAQPPPPHTSYLSPIPPIYLWSKKNCHVEKFQISMHDKCGDF